jgi:NADPH:quinone reductase-like Zn-dependent oxidoreductase
MKAVFLENQGGPLIVREVPVPFPGPSEVIVRIAAAPVNPSDLARLRNGHTDNDLKTFIPGLEGSGTVVAAGKGVLPRLWLGKRVACSTTRSTSGTWAEYMVTNAGSCFPLSSKVSDEQGSMTLINPLTAIEFFKIIRQGRHKAIINNPAGSALGRMIEILAGKNNIHVINIVRNQKQAENLMEAGSPYVLNSSDPSFINNLETLACQLEATVLFDAVCNNQLPAVINVLPRNSSVIIYGNLSLEEHILINPRTLLDKNIRVSGFYLANKARENGVLKNMLNILEVRRLMNTEIKIAIHERYPLTRAQEAIETYMKNMSAGKIVLVP